MLGLWLIKIPLLAGLISLLVFIVSPVFFRAWPSVEVCWSYLLPVMSHLLLYCAGLLVGFSRLAHPRGEIGVVELVGGWAHTALTGIGRLIVKRIY